LLKRGTQKLVTGDEVPPEPRHARPGLRSTSARAIPSERFIVLVGDSAIWLNIRRRRTFHEQTETVFWVDDGAGGPFPRIARLDAHSLDQLPPSSHHLRRPVNRRERTDGRRAQATGQ